MRRSASSSSLREVVKRSLGLLCRIEMNWLGVSSLPRTRALLRQQRGRVIEAAGCLAMVALLLPFSGQAGAQTAHFYYNVNVGSGFTNPSGVAVDSQGDVFVTDIGALNVYEIVAVNGLVSGGSTVNTLAAPGSGYGSPRGVAVDSAGDVFVADAGNAGNSQPAAVYEIPAGGGSIITMPAPTGGYGAPYGVAVDGS